MKTKTCFVTFSWFFVALVIIIIFQFSAQNVQSSTDSSNMIISKIIGKINNGKLLEALINSWSIDTITTFIRKIGHFLEYSLLGLALFNALFHTFKMRNKHLAFYSVAVASIIANYDELSQLFALGREPSGIDVIVDLSGALFGVILILVALKLFKSIKKEVN